MRNLIRCVALLALVLASFSFLPPTESSAADTVPAECYYRTVRGPDGPTLELYCPGGSGGGGGGGGGTSKCFYLGSEIPCADERGVFYAPYGCWLNMSPVPTTDPLATPLYAAHGGSGVVHLCYVGFGGSPLYVWLADANPPPNPAVLAARAVTQMHLRAPAIGIVPESQPGRIGVVGLPVWMWAADPGPSVTGPITRSVSERGYTVTATGRLDRFEWKMGDGEVVTCRTAGTPYHDSFGLATSPDCGYRYTKQGQYVVEVTAYWRVAWSGIGQTGRMDFEFGRTAPLTIGEVQVINR